jgi:Na+-transporting NADH:ubiquinone oxidoreductase subunit NqrB
VGEHLGYALTGAWSVMMGAALVQTAAVPSWLGVAGILVGAVLELCSFEFIGPFEREGWTLAGAVVPFAYIAWSLWLIATGVALIA